MICAQIRAAVSHDVKVPAEFKDPEVMRPMVRPFTSWGCYRICP
jgi:hypothetical protein